MELTDVQRKFIDNKLDTLCKSKFRSGFKLKKKDIDYISNKGYETLEEHAYRFVTERLAPEIIDNDGKQTPMRGHPVFIAQHATACCCRGCLYKWHHIKKDKVLSEKEIRFIVCLIIEWIKRNER